MKMSLKEVIAARLNDNRNPVFVACDEYVAAVESFYIKVEADGSRFIYGKVVNQCGDGLLPRENGEPAHFGDIVRWYIASDDCFYTEVAEAAEAAAQAVINTLVDEEEIF